MRDEAGGIGRLLTIMARLRDPQGGCPWDLEQDFASIAPYTLEEAYEVEDAIVRGDMPALCDELGDLLLQVVFHARMAEEAKHFAFDDVVRAISDKLVRRHPHVFGDGQVGDADAQLESWEAIKTRERAARGETDSPLEMVPRALPALTRAAKLQRRAERAGLGRLVPEPPLERLDEEALGQRLFGLVASAGRLGLDPEQALRRANERFLEQARERR
jgi:MazG family protein